MSHSCSGNTISSQLTPPEMLMKRLSIVWPKEPKYRFASSSPSSPNGGFLTVKAVQFREHFPNPTPSLPWPNIATEARRVKQVVVDSLSQEHRKDVDLSKHVVRFRFQTLLIKRASTCIGHKAIGLFRLAGPSRLVTNGYVSAKDSGHLREPKFKNQRFPCQSAPTWCHATVENQ